MKIEGMAEPHAGTLLGREFLFGEPKSLAKFEAAVDQFQQAIRIDLNYAQAYAGLGWAYVFDYMNCWGPDPDRSLELGRLFGERAVEKDPDEPLARISLFLAAIFQKDLDFASAEAQRALALNPNFALAYNSLGTIRIYEGEPMAAVPLIEQAMRLDPAWTKQYLHFLGVAYHGGAGLKGAAGGRPRIPTNDTDARGRTNEDWMDWNRPHGPAHGESAVERELLAGGLEPHP